MKHPRDEFEFRQDHIIRVEALCHLRQQKDSRLAFVDEISKIPGMDTAD